MRALLDRLGEQYAADEDSRHITIPSNEGVPELLRLGRELEESRIAVEDIGIRRPTLDDVFLVLTGRGTEALTEDGKVPATAARDDRSAAS